MSKSIQHQFFFPHSSEVVWDYLTKPELMAQWLMPNDFEPFVGYDFQFTTKPLPDVDFDGIIYCKVLELARPGRLSYSWKLGPGNGIIVIDSIVEWTLVPKEGGTELLLVHSGFKEGQGVSIVNMMNEGWLKNIHKIATLLNTAYHGTSNA